MEPQVPGPSFIPKKPEQKTQAAKPRRTTQSSALILFAVSAFIISGLLAGAVFFYERQQQSLLAEANQALTDKIEGFSLEELSELYEQDNRIKLATKLLDQHIAVTRVLKALELSTSEQVQYISFNFTQDGVQAGGEADAKLTSLTLTGQTGRFNNLLVQRDALSSSEVLGNTQLTSVSFSNNDDNESFETEDTAVGTDTGSPEGVAQKATNNRSVTFNLDSGIPSSAIQYTGRYQDLEIPISSSVGAGDAPPASPEQPSAANNPVPGNPEAGLAPNEPPPPGDTGEAG